MKTDKNAIIEDMMESYRKDYLADLPSVFDELEEQFLKLEKAKTQDNMLAELYRSVHNLK